MCLRVQERDALGRDRFASSGRAISSAGSRIISLETIDQTETGRRWLTMFTFLRLQLKSYINGQQAYKVKKNSNCLENYHGVMCEFGDPHLQKNLALFIFGQYL